MHILNQIYRLVEKNLATIIIANDDGGVTLNAGGTQSIGYQYYDNLVRYLGQVEIYSVKLGDRVANGIIKAALAHHFFNFAWVKDDKVVLVHADSLHGLTKAETEKKMQETGMNKVDAWNSVKERVFQEAIEVEATLKKGGHKAGKRMSGDEGTPWLTGHTYRTTDLPRIMWVDWLDADGAEDGGGIIMERFAKTIIDQENVKAPEWKANIHRHRLEHAGSYEARIRIPEAISEHEFGTKWKGDLIRRSVVADPSGKIITSKHCDLILPTGSAKTEVKYTGADFWIGLRPRHWKDRCWLDIQSTIDLHEIITNDYILNEIKTYATEYLIALRNGEITPEPLDNIHTEEQFEKLGNWVQGEYFASGGKTMWFAAMVRRVANQFLAHLTNTVSEKFSLPVKGGRFYMCSDRLHGHKVEPGQIYLHPESSRAVISHKEITDVFGVMGGGDSDDALQLPMYADKATGKVMVIAHRQPNQYGEYWLFELAPGSWQAENLPVWEKEKLPTRIDLQGREFLTLEPSADEVGENPEEYTMPNLLMYVNRSIDNLGILGGCVLAMEEEISNGLTPTFPFPMEEIVDGPVQWGWDASPAREAQEKLDEELMDVATSMYFIKRKTRTKVNALIRLGRVTEEQANDLDDEGLYQLVLEHSKVKKDHWLDQLIQGIKDIGTMFEKTIPMIAALASPPLELYLAGEKYEEEGSNLRRQFGRIIKAHKGQNDEIPKDSWDEIILEMDKFMNKYPLETQYNMLLGAARNAYTDAGNSDGYASDGVLFIGNNGPKFLEVLRTIPYQNSTMLKSIAWDGETVSVEDGAPIELPTLKETVTLPIAMTMAWYKVGVSANKLTGEPKDISKEDRIHWHKAIEKHAQRLVGQQCHIVTNNDREEVMLANGTCIGNVAPKRRPFFPAGKEFTIGSMTAKDGNFYAIAVM